ncbi:MAG: hypothetical protein J0H06_06905 [Actinobacteria bacterium]|nr:hypothetical protein [Actinomycetota bacterium]
MAEQAQAAAEALETGSVGILFFEELARSARHDIDRDGREDAEQMLGWH